MTTERAIELLHRLQDEQFDGIHGDERRKALEMAVRALEGDGDTISRKMAIDAVDSETVSTNPEHFKSSEKFIKFMDDDDIASFGKWQWANGFNTAVVAAKIQLEKLPSAQPERDMPVKPIETTDKAWGIPKRQAVCPKCDYYLGHVAFLGDYKGKRVTYCETCGQAIDWEGWNFDE